MTSVDDRIREELRALVDSAPATDQEARLGAILRRGRRAHRAGIVVTIAAVVVAVSVAGVALTLLPDSHEAGPIVPIPSPILRASSANIDGTAQVSSTVVRTGQVFTITTTIDKYNGLSGFARVDPGDGTPIPAGNGAPSCSRVAPRAAPQARNAQPSGGLDKLTYAYRVPGTYQITVSFLAFWPCGTYEETAGPLTFTIRVLPGARPSAGPFEPVLIQGGINEDRTGVLHLDASFHDRGGWISQIIVSWGDGTNRIFEFPFARCTDPVTRWPSSEQTLADKHTYDRAGAHKVTFKVIRSGCDEKDRTAKSFSHEFTTPLKGHESLIPTGRLLPRSG